MIAIQSLFAHLTCAVPPQFDGTTFATGLLQSLYLPPMTHLYRSLQPKDRISWLCLSRRVVSNFRQTLLAPECPKKESLSLMIISLSGEISIANYSREKIAADRRHVNTVAFAFER